MKELSIEEKAKRFDEALKKFIELGIDVNTADMYYYKENIFNKTTQNGTNKDFRFNG